MHHITEKYKSELKSHDDFRIKVEELVKELLIQNCISYHKIESRIKDPVELEEKIIRKNEKYETLEDITDLVGIRVVTFFDDDVDKVANIISSEFQIDKENTIDKRKLEIDRFGYKSLHYVVYMKTERQNLTEYKRFGNRKIEIQIRSILQHAWAEIEHDLGYKTELSIPDELKRDFYRVAALLETADLEFLTIKKKLKNYESTISSTIVNNPEEVEINTVSLRTYVESSAVIKDINSELKKNPNITIVGPLEVENYIDKLYFLDVNTIKKLDKLLVQYKNQIPLFAEKWHKGRVLVTQGISIIYLAYLIVGSKNDISFARKYYLKHYKNAKDDLKLEVVAIKIVELYNELTSQEKS